ncbi:MAG TPA: hypothetical protein VFO85_10760 [Vicinamibacteria bacterium]|nr:hypothetical protein [Vicinamibacteria bacterium]
MSEPVREFLLHVEKTITTRRLYAAHMATYKEAAERLVDKCRAAVGEAGFTLRVGATDLFLEKASVLNRPRREDCFFFGLYRDGLRELSFAPGVTGEELDALLRVLEAEEKRLLGPADDTVNLLWRADLSAITYRAVDGIGDQEDEDQGAGGKDDFGALVADLVARIKEPAPPMTGQSHAFVLDADVGLTARDLHYEATTTHRRFEDNPTVLRLSAEEAAALREELGEEREAALLDRFVDVLLVIQNDPSRAAAAALAPVFQRLLEGYWAARDFDPLARLLGRLAEAAQAAPHPESRAAAGETVARFLNEERVGATLAEVETGAVPLELARRLWDLAGAGVFERIVDFWSTLHDGPLRGGVTEVLRGRIAADPDLLRGLLASTSVARVRAALSLLDERLERSYGAELLALIGHADEHVRHRALALAGKVGGEAGREALWRAAQEDPATSIRLFAFRHLAVNPFPGLAQRLVYLLTAATFGQRPLWEREKWVRLLGAIADQSARPLFESWIPRKKWFWQPPDHESAELAFHGLAALGGPSLEIVKAAAAERGDVGAAAKKALAGLARPGSTGAQ